MAFDLYMIVLFLSQGGFWHDILVDKQIGVWYTCLEQMFERG